MNATASRPIAQSARIRAALLAMLPTATEPVTVAQMQQHPSLQALDATIPQTTSVVLDLHKKALLRRIHVSRKEEPNTKYAYEMHQPARGVQSSGTLTRVKKDLPVNNLPPDVKLDIIKSTGRLRIEFRGLRIEIGAVE